MRIFSADETAAALPYPELIAKISELFAAGLKAPLRHHHTLPNPQGQEATLLLMPAWQGQQGFGGVKIANIHPDNAKRGLPAVIASYLLFREDTGEHLALLNGSVLTARRTAAASVLGARYLAHPQTQTLLILGAGRVARELPEAFSSLFPLKRILIWNRSPARAHSLVNELQALQRWKVELVSDLKAAVAQAVIYPIKSGHIKKRVVGKNLPQMLPDFGSDWQSANEAGCNRFRYIQTPFGVWLRG